MTYKIEKLGLICEFQGGSQPPKSNFIYEAKKDYIRFIQIRDFKSDKNFTYIPKSERNKICNQGDILIGRYGASVGKILTGLSGAYNVALMKVIPNEKILNKKFLYYYLVSDLFQSSLRDVSERSAQNGFSKDDIYNFPFLLPSLSEQKNIVIKIDKIFSEINEIKKIEEVKLKTNQVLIQNFLNKIFTTSKDLKKLSDCCKINPPKSELNSFDNNTDVSFLPMKDMGINKKLAIPNQNKKLKDVRSGYTYFSERDVLLAKITPCFENGKLGIVSNLTNGVGFGSSEYIVFRPNNNLKNEWLYYFLNRSSFRIKGSQNMSGAVGHKRVNKDFIENIQIPIPSLKEQEKILMNLESLFNHSKIISDIKLKKENELKALKKSILNNLLNHKLLNAA